MLVLGARGMLGSAAVQVLSVPQVDVLAPPREDFDVEHGDLGALLDATRPSWVLNAAAVLAPAIDPADPASMARAVAVNALFPLQLAAAAGHRGIRVIAPSTDGVFSGRTGGYPETAEHDAPDHYGRTKSLGEAPGEHVLNVRCSLVGPESRTPARSLLGKVLEAPPGDRLRGWVDHRWNGVTSLHLARVVRGLVLGSVDLHGPVHLVPADVVTKADLLRLIAAAHGRSDLTVEAAHAPAPTDRSLITTDPARNRTLWHAGGYPRPPTVAEMISELAG